MSGQVYTDEKRFKMAADMSLKYATGHPLEGLAAGQFAEDIAALLLRAQADALEAAAVYLEARIGTGHGWAKVYAKRIRSLIPVTP